MRVSASSVLRFLPQAVIICGMIVIASCWSSETENSSKGPMGGDAASLDITATLAPSDPAYRNVMCGPVSLSKALGCLGFSATPSVIASTCEVTRTGVSMSDLLAYAESIVGAKARQCNMTWEELLRFDGVAVLFVDGDHYIAVDPRDTSSDQRECVKSYDFNRPAYRMNRSELMSRWHHGESLAISRLNARTEDSREGPRIQWERCFMDNGVLEKGLDASFEFPFVNLGPGILEIKGVELGCSCTSYELSTRELAPMESGMLKVNIDTTDLDGVFQKRIVVSSNDATRNKAVLQVSGAVPRARVVSEDFVQLRRMPRGTSRTERLFVSDPGFRGFSVKKAWIDGVRGQNGPLEPGAVSCEIEWSRIGSGLESHRHTTTQKLSADDLSVDLTFAVSDTCPLGIFSTSLNVTLEAGGAMSAHRVDVSGKVIEDVAPFPPIALVVVNDAGVGGAAVELRSHSGKPFKATKAWVESEGILNINRETGKDHVYRIDCITSPPVDTAIKRRYTAYVKLANGRNVSIPIVLTQSR
ncbi:MAG: hypothetical protein CMJ58_12905 [Planctomycetaceae bacterium]|nr:hypothetical protein [Planctomycetaceae bacterium]